MSRKRPTDFSRAVGQYVGNLIADAIEVSLEGFPLVLKQRWKNSYKNEHEIDVVVGTRDSPLVLIDSKYIKGVRHAREKANEIANMLVAIRESHDSVKSCVAVLAGSFTDGSKQVLTDRGIEVYHLGMPVLAAKLRSYGITIDWADEETREAGQKAWEAYHALSKQDLEKIRREIFEGTDIPSRLRATVTSTIS